MFVNSHLPTYFTPIVVKDLFNGVTRLINQMVKPQNWFNFKCLANEQNVTGQI